MGFAGFVLQARPGRVFFKVLSLAGTFQAFFALNIYLGAPSWLLKNTNER